MAFTICNTLTLIVKLYTETNNTTICKTIKSYAQIAKGQKRKNGWTPGCERWTGKGIIFSMNSCQKEQHMQRLVTYEFS